MGTRTYPIVDQSSFLPYVLRANAVFSLACSLLFTLSSMQVATFLGIQDTLLFGVMSGTTFILLIGIGLLLFAAMLVYTSFIETLSPKDGYTIIVQDVIWVVVSAIILVAGLLPLTTAGSWAVLIVADVVAMFAILQYLGIRRMQR